MSDLLVGLLTAMVATNPPASVSNWVQQQTGFSVRVPDPSDPVEQEYQRLLAKDDAAQEEVDKWIQEGGADSVAESTVRKALLLGKIERRLDLVREDYEAFLRRHPNHARARLAYGSFLNDIGEEDAGRVQWEKARELDEHNPAAWNNLANYYGHNGPVVRAFEYYEKAIALNPAEPVYYQNLATTVYLFRRDATNYYNVSVDEVLRKAMALYEKAMELDPNNFVLATDVAQTYYGIPPVTTGDVEEDKRTERAQADQALAAWRRALKLARDDVERQGVLVHLARIQIKARRFAEASRTLEGVTNQMYSSTKALLLKKLAKDKDRETGEASSVGTVTEEAVSVDSNE